MSTAYKSAIDLVRELKQKHGNWQNISETDAARMMMQNRFRYRQVYCKNHASRHGRL